MESTLSDLLGKALSKLKQANGPSAVGDDGEGGRTENWLRNASLSRAEMHIRNHAEGLDLTRWVNVSADELDESGLDADEKRLIGDWYGNRISGTHCICLLQAKWGAEAAERRGLGSSGAGSSSSTSSSSSSSTGQTPRGHPTRALLDMIGSLIDFPVSALEVDEDNYLYSRLFSRPPLAVIGETLRILQEKAIENNPTTMLAEQVNLAFKQFRVERIRAKGGAEHKDDCDVVSDSDSTSDVEEVEEDEDEEEEEGGDGEERRSGADGMIDGREEQMYFKILMELVKQYVKASDLSSMGRKGVSAFDVAADADVGDSTSAVPWMLDVNTMQIECELDTPLEQVMAEAEALSHVELNDINIPLKNYITRLSSLKHGLDRTLKEVEESESYLALGVHKNSSDVEIKKAYHRLAVKTHPDKPGGDTAKFQVLQKAYHEIQKKRGIELAAQAELKAQMDKGDEASGGREAAHALVRDMHAGVTVCKSAAEQIAALAQMAIHLAKTTAKVEEQHEFPEGVGMLRQIIFDEDGGCRLDLLRAALEPTESMSEALQTLSANSVELAGCGPRYASCASRATEYAAVTEASMQAGLNILRCVTSLMQVERHVNECVEKLQESIWQVEEDAAIHDIIAQMVVTVVKCCSATMNSVAEKALGAALVAADVSREAQGVLDAVEKEALEEATRAAEVRERMHDFENDQNGANAAAAAAEAEAQKKAEEEKKKKDEENEPKEGDGLADLQTKVKNLQVQIRVQNISILQTLNAEARHLQGKLQRRLVELVEAPANGPVLQGPVMRLVADLVDHSCEALRTACSSGAVQSLEDWDDLVADRLGWMQEGKSGRLALLPDLRTRALWMGVLADRDAVDTLVNTEVRRRLKACLKSCPVECSWAVRGAKTRRKDGSTVRTNIIQDSAKSSVDRFLGDVATSITALASVVVVTPADGGPDGEGRDAEADMSGKDPEPTAASENIDV